MSHYLATGAAGAGYTDDSGVCRPTDNATRAKFVLYQQRLNDVAAHINANKIGADGVIGSKTLTLHAQVFPYDPAVLSGLLNCAYVANSIDASIKAAGERYTGLTQAPPIAHSPPKPVVAATPGAPLPPVATFSLAEAMSNPFVLGGVGVAVFLLFRSMDKKKGRKKR